MDLIEVRRRILMLPHIKTYGGLPVLIDNYRYSPQDGPFDSSGTVDSEYFIAGWYDSGSTGSKRYRYAMDAHADYMTTRWFIDITAQSVDYWRPNKTSEKTFSSPGQFIAATIYKATAADFYLFDVTNNRYIFKGKNVT